jgi:glycosyltransferase involved in cell wall biosynthesis
MDIGVVIPLFNKQAHIERALNAALRAIYRATDLGLLTKKASILVVDDGSTDSGPDIVNFFQNEYSIVKLHRQTNAGASAARNTGIDLSPHEWIAFLDADDDWHSEHIAEMARLARDYPQADVVATGYQRVNPDGSVNDPDFYEIPHPNGILERFHNSMSYGAMPLSSSSVAVKKRALRELGGFPVGETHGEDRIMWARLARDMPIAISSQKTALYHLDAENRSTQSWTPEKGSAYLRYLVGELEKEDAKSQRHHDLLDNIASERYYFGRKCALEGFTDQAFALSDTLLASGHFVASQEIIATIENPNRKGWVFTQEQSLSANLASMTAAQN